MSGLLASMFLRHCAFLTGLYMDRDSSSVWYFATLNVTITVANFAFVGVTLFAVLFNDWLSPAINPITAPSEVRLAVFLGVPLLCGYFVDKRLANFRNHLPSLASYKTFSERLKWILEILFNFACIASIVVLLVFFGSR